VSDFSSHFDLSDPPPQERLRNELLNSEKKISMDQGQIASLEQQLSQQSQELQTEMDSLRIRLKSAQTSLQEQEEFRARLESEKVPWSISSCDSFTSYWMLSPLTEKTRGQFSEICRAK
jgi:hypothetical protein